MNVNLIKEIASVEIEKPDRSVESGQEEQNTNPRLRVNLLSRQNKAVKRIMAQELERLGLSDRAIERILHVPSRSCRLNRSPKSR